MHSKSFWEFPARLKYLSFCHPYYSNYSTDLRYLCDTKVPLLDLPQLGTQKQAHSNSRSVLRIGRRRNTGREFSWSKWVKREHMPWVPQSCDRGAFLQRVVGEARSRWLQFKESRPWFNWCRPRTLRQCCSCLTGTTLSPTSRTTH